MLTRLLSAVVAGVLLLALAACGEDDTPSTASAPDATGCIYTPDGAPAEAEPPPEQAAYSGEVGATITTSAGELSATLDADGAPCTVNSFASLAEQDYFDGTPCHRLTSDPAGIFVLQCGDPTGTGGGGPGYTIEDEVAGDETYPAGTLAMAKTAAPDSGGSQFFVVYEDSPLPPEYTVFGSIDAAGIEVVRGVAAKGETPPGDGAPNKPVTLESVTVE